MKSKTPEYIAWGSMRQRCGNPKSQSFHHYGGRGISVCEQWQSFEQFLADMGPRPDGMSLDRYPDVNGNYEPKNCRWATNADQARNKRSHIREDVGVGFVKRDNRWLAWISVNSKIVKIGSFATSAAAIVARKAAEKKYWTDGEPLPIFNGVQRNSTTGVLGVSRASRGDFYAAYAYVKRKRVHIGHYRSIQLATAARAEYLSKHGISAPVVPTLSPGDEK